MTQPTKRNKFSVRKPLVAAVCGMLLLAAIGSFFWFIRKPVKNGFPYKYVSTVAGINKEFGEPFGVASRDAGIYVSDGQNGKIWLVKGNTTAIFAEGLDTPSSIAFDKNGNLIVADSGSNTVRSVDPKGSVKTIAGIEGHSGYADGDAAVALFSAPIGIAIAEDGKIFVADTYNDRIRVIENGKVSTVAGSSKGYSDGLGEATKFDTPCGLSVWQDKLLVADTGNRRLRVVEQNGRVWTLAGTGETDLRDGLLANSAFVEPTAITTDADGTIIVADGNAIRQIGGTAIPVIRTISDERRGLADGIFSKSRFNRPSGLAFDTAGDLFVTDSENQLLRRFAADSSGRAITAEEILSLKDRPEEFRNAQPARWPYNPPTAKRDIAGTLGELRGEIKPGDDNIWFHNGLDIAGAYGETARFVRTEKVLRPISAENFGTLRELIRLPTLGYIHIRLGRDAGGKPFGDPRFQFVRDAGGHLTGVRVPRGTRFEAGEAIGTLNPMNHVHLIAGRTGSEMNALDALILPGISDTRPPVIESVTLFDKNWRELETVSENSRITLTDPIRIVVRAYDQVDGNSDRRRLGVYNVGYQVYRGDAAINVANAAEIRFDVMPSNDLVMLVYAPGSHSGATGETIFSYIATNSLLGDKRSEGFLDPSAMEPGTYTATVFAADYFGNRTERKFTFEVKR